MMNDYVPDAPWIGNPPNYKTKEELEHEEMLYDEYIDYLIDLELEERDG